MYDFSQKLADYAIIPIRLLLTAVIGAIVFPPWLIVRAVRRMYLVVYWVILLPFRGDSADGDSDKQLTFEWHTDDELVDGQGSLRGVASAIANVLLAPFRLAGRSALLAWHGAKFLLLLPSRLLKKKEPPRRRRARRKAPEEPQPEPATQDTNEAPPPPKKRRRARAAAPPVTPVVSAFASFGRALFLLPWRIVRFVAFLPIRFFRRVASWLPKRSVPPSNNQLGTLVSPAKEIGLVRSHRDRVRARRQLLLARPARSLVAYFALIALDIVVVAAVGSGVFVTFVGAGVPPGVAMVLPFVFGVVLTLRHVVYERMFPTLGIAGSTGRWYWRAAFFVIRLVVRLVQFAVGAGALFLTASIGGTTSPTGAIAFAAVTSFLGSAAIQDLQVGRTTIERGTQLKPYAQRGSASFPPTVLVHERYESHTIVIIREVGKGGGDT